MPNPDENRDPHQKEWEREIAAQEKRRRRARHTREESIWFGLGMMGVVGWSVAIPVLACVSLGLWIDRTYPSRHSWTLMLLLVGVALGALNAWYWLSRERRIIERHGEENDDPRP